MLVGTHKTALLRWRGGHSQQRPALCSRPLALTMRRGSRAVAAGPPNTPALQHLLDTRGRGSSRSQVIVNSSAAAADPAESAALQWRVQIVTHVPPDAPQQIGLEMTVISSGGDRSPVMPLVPTRPPETVKRATEDLQGRRDFFAVDLPKDFVPAAVLVRDMPDQGDMVFQDGGSFSQLYLKLISFESDSSTDRVSMLANTYISTRQGNRLLVRDDALTSKELRDNLYLRELMEDELTELRGEGWNKKHADQDARRDPDRIYRYATYNDLSGDITKAPNNRRPPLGGKDYPYPRRLATNRGLYPSSDCEVAPTLGNAALVPGDVITGILSRLVGPLAPPMRRIALQIIRVTAVGIGLGVLGWLVKEALSGETWATVLAGVALVLDCVVLPRLFGRVGQLLKDAKEDGVVPTPWTPKDDNFDTDKTRGFIGNALSGTLQGLLANLMFLRGKEFENEGQVLSLYREDQRQQEVGSKGEMSVLVPTGGPGDFSMLLADMPKFRIDTRSGAELPDTGDSEAETRMRDEGMLLDLGLFPVPRSIAYREDTWSTDAEFGRMFLAGQNPVVIQVLESDKLEAIINDPDSHIKDIDEATQGKLLEGQTLKHWAAAAATKEPRLFLVDYWDLYGVLDELGEVNAGSNRVQHAGRCILFRTGNDQRQMVPVIIELAHSKLEEVRTYTSQDHPHVWQVAKAIFQSIDSGWHQLISHWLRTHACIEPFLIATRRFLPVAHPMFRLLMPHFRYTLPINAAARGSLINAGGVIEDNFSPGPFSMRLSAVVYGLHWQFKEEGLMEDLKRRGFLNAAGELRVTDYPYAEDGLLIWNALTKYFTKYIDMYYTDDEAVKDDTWLQGWWKDVQTEAHPDANKDGWMELNSKTNLLTAVTTIAWVASAHHAAVNFGQYAYSGWMPSHSPLCRKPAPAKGSKEWEALVQAKEAISQEFFSYVAPPAVATSVMGTVKLLSAHAQDEHYLSTDAQDWLPLETDPKLRDIFESFVKELKTQVEPEINRRNDAGYPSRTQPGGLAYTLLYPSSDKPGMTMQGVPYSISI